MPSYEVATIGAGLSGLTLALALHQQGINSTIYQSRPESLNIGGAVMLYPTLSNSSTPSASTTSSRTTATISSFSTS